MSYNPPTPNNLTLVKFVGNNIDFTKAGTTIIGQLEYDENVFIPTSATVVYTNALGTNGTQAVVTIDNGTTGENIATATLPATPVQTTASGNISQTILTNTTNGYVLGAIPVGTNGSNGAAATQSVRVNVTTPAVPSLQSQSRATANNISTITVSSVPSWITAGAVINVQSLGNAAYNGTVTVISKTATTFSYYNPSLTTESIQTDTAGRIGALTGDVYVTGLLV